MDGHPKQRIELISAYVSEKCNKNPDGFVDLNVIFEGAGLLSPLPSSISMVDEIPKPMFFEMFIENLRRTNKRLKVKTWSALLRWYQRKFLKFDDRSTSFCMEMLFILSQANVDEFFEAANASKQKGGGSVAVVETSATCFDREMQNLAACLYFASPELRQVEEIESHLREYLLRPAIVKALRESLYSVVSSSSKALNVTVEDVRGKIQGTRIYQGFFSGPPLLAGCVVRDGVALCGVPIEILLSEDSHARAKASVYTLAVHECAHYLIRSFFDDFAFASPSKYSVDGGFRFDSEFPHKLLELGRAVELRIFDGIQPDWTDESSSTAAALFVERVFADRDDLPLISRADHAKFDLKARHPSCSMAGELNPEYFRNWLGYIL